MTLTSRHKFDLDLKKILIFFNLIIFHDNLLCLKKFYGRNFTKKTVSQSHSNIITSFKKLSVPKLDLMCFN